MRVKINPNSKKKGNAAFHLQFLGENLETMAKATVIIAHKPMAIVPPLIPNSGKQDNKQVPI